MNLKPTDLMYTRRLLNGLSTPYTWTPSPPHRECKLEELPNPADIYKRARTRGHRGNPSGHPSGRPELVTKGRSEAAVLGQVPVRVSLERNRKARGHTQPNREAHRKCSRTERPRRPSTRKLCRHRQFSKCKENALGAFVVLTCTAGLSVSFPWVPRATEALRAQGPTNPSAKKAPGKGTISCW